MNYSVVLKRILLLPAAEGHSVMVHKWSTAKALKLLNNALSQSRSALRTGTGKAVGCVLWWDVGSVQQQSRVSLSEGHHDPVKITWEGVQVPG